MSHRQKEYVYNESSRIKSSRVGSVCGQEGRKMKRVQDSEAEEEWMERTIRYIEWIVA